MILAPSGNRKRLNRVRLCVEELEPRNLLSGGILSPADGDDPMGLDLLRKIERENALLAQQQQQAGASVLGQGTSHVAIAGDSSAGTPSGATTPANGTSAPPPATRNGQDAQTQLLVQILHDNPSALLTSPLLASAGKGGGSSGSAASTGAASLVPNPATRITSPTIAPTAASPATSPSTTPVVANGAGPPPPNGTHNPPTILPTEADPVVRSNPSSFGGDPMSGGFSEAGVRYADGAVRLSFSDLASDGFGMPWGQTRYWTNSQNVSAPGSPFGNGMAVSQLPYLLNVSGTLYVVTGGTSVRTFDLVGSNYVERYFLQDSLVHNTGASEFDLTDTQGDVFKFNDSTASPAYLFKSFADPNGNTISVTSYTSSQVAEVQRSTTVGSTTYTESYLYTYLSSPDPNVGNLSSVVERRKVGTSSWTTVRQVQYAYYGSSESHGNLGDLKTATIQDGSGSTIDTEYYRYYKTESGGYTHGLKYYFDAASYARLKAVYSDPTTATDSQAAPYAANYFEYDTFQRVTKAVVQAAGSSASSGGQGTYTFSYTGSPNANGYNLWLEKTVETLPDGNTNTVYTNYAGEIMLKIYHDATSGLNSDWFTEFDFSGRVILQAGPTTVTGYNDTYPDLLHNMSGNYQYLSDTIGLVSKVDYYTTTTAGESTAGGVAGYEQDQKLSQGETGTAITLNATQYFKHTAGGISVDPVANTVAFRNTDGTGGETTSYSYTWFSGTTQMQSVAVSAPTISSTQNGPGTADTTTTFFGTSERPIWSKDPDGFLTYVAYDPVTGAATKTINDVDTTQTGDFQNLPTGWSTPSGGGLHLITNLVVDALGRPTQITDPLGDITYLVYLDTNHEERIYRGWNTSTNLPTGPTEDYRIDRTNSYFETLTMTATPHLTGGAPDGSEAISGVQTLARQYISAGGQDTADDAYFNLSSVTYSTSPHIGTLNTNYYETSYGYDSRGRLSTTTLPTNTVETTNYDGLDRVTSTAIGTTTLATTTTASYVYDNNTLGGSTAVGDGNLTQIIAHPGGSAADRVTEMYYDWRDRLVASKSGVQSSEDTTTHRPILYNTYDNLDEVIEVQQYDGDGVTITSTNGVPNAPSTSLLRAETLTSYDDQRRVYKTQEYSVDPSSGSVSTNALTTQVWYNHRGEVIKTSHPGGAGFA
jgi:YD repeat-containing protein